MAVSNPDIFHLTSAEASSSGGAITGSSIPSSVANNVWPNVTDADRIAGIVISRKTFWKNGHATDALAKPSIFVKVVPTNAAFVIGLGIDSADDADALQGNMSAFSGSAKVALVSDGADTRVVTLFGMDASGSPVPVTETVTLNGMAEVLSVNTYTKCWAAFADGPSASRIVLLKQGSGGTTRGTIGLNKKGCWLWITATSIGAGLTLPDLAASQSYGLWQRLTVAAGAGSVRPDTLTIRVEETI